MNIIKMFEEIDCMSEEYIGFWRDICSIESESGDISALNSVADSISIFAQRQGFGVHRQVFDKAGDFLTVELNEGAEKGYAFLAHMDTVHKKGKFGYPPVKISGDIMTGPGVIDCKGGIAVALLAMKALAKNGYDRHTRLILTSDEEVSNTFSGQDGIDFIIKNAKGFNGAFNCEVGVDGEALVARKGILRLKVRITGKASHSGISYFDGISAIKEAAYKIIELEKMSESDGVTYNCAIISGGEAANIIPAYCEFTVDIRVKTLDEMQCAYDTVQNIAAHSFVDGTSSNIEVISQRPPLVLTEENIGLYTKLEAVASEYKLEKLNMAESGGGSDSAYTQMAGVPTVCGLGTTGAFCHTPKEYASVRSLSGRAKLLAAVCAKN